MTKLLDEAFAEASKLPEGDQDAIASWLMDELLSERQWDRAFADSQMALSSLADEALAEHREGRTRELDPDAL